MSETRLDLTFLNFKLEKTFHHTQVHVPDRKSICPDRPRQNMTIIRPPQTEQTYVQIFVRSKTSMRSSCVEKSLCPVFRALKITNDQTFARSNFENLCVYVRALKL